jgi:hypothetical protein
MRFTDRWVLLLMRERSAESRAGQERRPVPPGSKQRPPGTA